MIINWSKNNKYYVLGHNNINYVTFIPSVGATGLVSVGITTNRASVSFSLKKAAAGITIKKGNIGIS